MIGDSAAYSGTIDFDMEATAGQKVKFDDGQHSSGTVTLRRLHLPLTTKRRLGRSVTPTSQP